MPGLVKLQKENANKIQVVGWHVGPGTSKDIEKIVKAQKLTYPIVTSPGWDEIKAWGAKGPPIVALVDKKGELRVTNLKPAVGEQKALDLAKE
jgi:hypothetical protein